MRKMLLLNGSHYDCYSVLNLTKVEAWCRVHVAERDFLNAALLLVRRRNVPVSMRIVYCEKCLWSIVSCFIFAKTPTVQSRPFSFIQLHYAVNFNNKYNTLHIVACYCEHSVGCEYPTPNTDQQVLWILTSRWIAVSFAVDVHVSDSSVNWVLNTSV